MYTLLETWTKRIINMYFLVLKICPASVEFCNYVTAQRKGVHSRLLSGNIEIEFAREAEINWGSELSRNLPRSYKSIFVIPAAVLRRVSLSLDTIEMKRVEIFEQRKN